MNKTFIITVGTLAIAFEIFAGPSLTAEQMTAISNLNSQIEAVLIVKSYFLSNIEKGNFDRCISWRLTQQFSEEDKVLVDKTFSPLSIYAVNEDCKNCFTNYLNFLYPPERTPLGSLLRKKYYIFDFNASAAKKMTIPDIILSFEALNAEHLDICRFNNWKVLFKDAYLKQLKKHFYNTGRSFAPKNGVSPLELYMTNVVQTLNAPRLNGLSQCLVDCGFDASLASMPYMPSNESILSLREEILTGEKENASPYEKFLLFWGLGVDGYNEMVRIYNGE